MDTSPSTMPSLDAYQLRLPSYEGPLDVLLRLIEREQLAINEISLLSILDQFLEFIRELKAPPPDVIAEFATVAGRLSLLKSRSLLPQPAKVAEEEVEPDLVRQLEEYRAVKVAGLLLDSRQRSGIGAFGRGDGIEWPAPTPARLAPQPSTALSKAVARWLSRIPPRPIPFPAVRVLTLREMISRIYMALDGERGTSFESIRETCHTRQDVAVAFLAMLTLLRRHMIVATQLELFGSISLTRASAEPGATPGNDAFTSVGAHESA